MKKIFKYQLLHLLLALLFLMGTAWYVNEDRDLLLGGILGISTASWFWLGILVPIVHQVYVAVVWRLELYRGSFTSLLGMKKAFVLYAIGFTVLFLGRLVIIIPLALGNAHTLAVEPYLAYALAGILTPLIGYLLYSVIKYFTIVRAFGIDHFDKEYKAPYVKEGIFKYTSNGMYSVGLSILFLPGLLLLSKAAIFVALFNYLYIWVHYYCTELPDMKEIYGSTP